MMSAAPASSAMYSGFSYPHIDDGRADLNLFGLRADGSQQRERRAELTGKVMHTEIGAVGAELFGCDGELNRLHEGVGCRSRLRLGRSGPMAK